jgi:hypothetical protein
MSFKCGSGVEHLALGEWFAQRNQESNARDGCGRAASKPGTHWNLAVDVDLK